MGRIPKAVKAQAINQIDQLSSNQALLKDDPNKSDIEEKNANKKELNQNSCEFDSLNQSQQDVDECDDLKIKIKEEVFMLTEQEVKNKSACSIDSGDLFNVIKQMSQNTNNLKSFSMQSYHHVYDINHTDDCLAQFLDSIDMHIRSPEACLDSSPHVNNNNSSPILETDAESLQSYSTTIVHNQLITPNSIEIKTNFLSIYMQMTNETIDPSYRVICSLLNDKIYQIYIENTEKTNENLKKTLEHLETNNHMEGFNAATKQEIWTGLVEFVPGVVRLIVSFVKEMPGLNELTPKDFTCLINNHMFDVYILIHSGFFIKDECFLRLPNKAHYSRYWMNRIKSKKKTDAIFDFVEHLNKLNLTTREKCLLIPLVITTHDENIEDLATLHVLNEYYTRAALYEFDLNKRDNCFIIELSKVFLEI